MKKKLVVGILSCVLVAGAATMAGCNLLPGNGNSGDVSGSSVSSSVAESTTWKVHFEKCTELVTNNIKDREVDKNGDGLLSEPVLEVMGDNPDEAELEGWYTESTYEHKWNFETDKVTSDLTLYAKWSKTFKVTYHVVYDTHDTTYQAPSWSVKEGTCAERKDAVADGYELLGYYADENYEKEFDFATPITADTDIYVKTSDNLYFNAETMDRNFSVWSANGTQENLSKELVEDGDESYIKVNYGTKNNNLNGVHTGAFGASSLGILLDGSQHLEFTFKNMGNATDITIYFSVMFDDLTWATMGFADYQYHFTEEQRNMTAEDDWITLTLELDKITMDKGGHGVSAWANAVKLGDFRIDFYDWEYATNENYPTTNNIAYIKEIKGVACDEYTSPSDSVTFTDSSKEDLEAVKQDSVNGWNFPKEFAKAQAQGDTVLYNTVDGLLAYAPYGSKNVEFTLKEGDLTVDRLSTVAFNLKNGGYGQTLKLTFRLSDGTEEWTVIRQTSLEQGMESFKDILLSMSSSENFAGTLKSIDFSLETNGIDNYIYLSALEVKGYMAAEIPGINFADNELAFTDGDGASSEFDLEELTTVVTVTKSGATIADATYSYPVGVYKTAEMVVKADGVSKITMKYTVGETEYSVEFLPTAEWSTVKAELASGVEKIGVVKGIKFEFTGVGSVALKSLEFKIDPTRGLDFSTSGYLEALKAEGRFTGGTTGEYDELTSSTKLCGTDPNAGINMYVGFYNAVTGCYDIQLGEGQKIYVIYQNTSSVGGGEQPIRFYYKANAHAENGVNPDGGDYSGYNDIQPLTNMSAGEWAVGCVEIESKFASENFDINKIDWRLTPHEGFSIRAIIVL